MPPHPHCSWRGLKEWKSLGIDMSTGSDEACKLYDATMTQYINMWDDPTLGGMETTMKKMLEADPNFVMGHVLSIGTSGKKTTNNLEFAQDVNKLAVMAKSSGVTPWERKHINAVCLVAEGKAEAASQAWDTISMEYPYDLLPLKFIQHAFIMRGYAERMRDSAGRAVENWKPDMPFYGNVLGMHAFGLEETSMYPEAERKAKKALEINGNDGWAAHALSHVLEMTGRPDEGMNFMSDSENGWSQSYLGCHNYWHWAVYCVEKGEYETALSILDDQVFPRMKSDSNALNITDASSLLYRLQMEGYDIGSRWNDVFDVSQSHLEDYDWPFADVNVFMACYGAKKPEVAQRLLDNIRNHVRSSSSEVKKLYKNFGLPIMEAIAAFENEEYDKAVNLMLPVRYSTVPLGGSNAQRDIFNIFLIHAAMKSSNPDHQRLASALLLERQTFRENSPMGERLLARALICHGNH